MKAKVKLKVEIEFSNVLFFLNAYNVHNLFLFFSFSFFFFFFFVRFQNPLTLSMSTRAGPVLADTSGAYSPIHSSPLIQTLHWLSAVSRPFLLLLLLLLLLNSFSSSSSRHHSTSNCYYSSHFPPTSIAFFFLFRSLTTTIIYYSIYITAAAVDSKEATVLSAVFNIR